MIEISRGSIVIIKVTGRKASEDGFSMGGSASDEESMMLYEKIDLESFPSFNDFYGNSVEVRDGCSGMVIEKVGRPWRIRNGEDIDRYDIYEVMISNSIYHVFKNNIEVCPNAAET